MIHSESQSPTGQVNQEEAWHLFTTKKINVTKIIEENKQTFQHAIWKTTTNKFNAAIIGICHPTYSVANQITNAQFLDEFLNWLPNQIIEHKNLIITGDINLHLKKLGGSSWINIFGQPGCIRFRISL